MTRSASPTYLDGIQAAAYLGGVTARTLARWRSEGRGPRFRRHGREALYTREDLDAWSEAQAASSTTEERERKAHAPNKREESRASA